MKGAVKSKKLYEVGETVRARWPGSKLWFEAVVLSANYEDDSFHLRFNDGQENEVPYSYLAVRIESLKYIPILQEIIDQNLTDYFVLEATIFSRVFEQRLCHGNAKQRYRVCVVAMSHLRCAATKVSPHVVTQTL